MSIAQTVLAHLTFKSRGSTKLNSKLNAESRLGSRFVNLLYIYVCMFYVYICMYVCTQIFIYRYAF
jgi:hypothetical protein